MASEVGSSLLLFIAAVGVAGLAGGVMAGVVGDMSSTLRDRGTQIADAMSSSITVVNDPNNVPYDPTSNTLTLYVKNTGSSTLVTEDALVLVNGMHRDATFHVIADTAAWRSMTVLEITVDVELDPGDHEVLVSVGTVTDRMQFRVA